MESSPNGEVAATFLCGNCHSILKDVMSKEKRKGDVVGPYAMIFSPFLEDIDCGANSSSTFSAEDVLELTRGGILIQIKWGQS